MSSDVGTKGLASLELLLDHLVKDQLGVGTQTLNVGPVKTLVQIPVKLKMSSEFLVDEQNAVNPSISNFDIEASPDQAMEEFEMIPDTFNSDGLADLEHEVNDLDEPPRHNPFTFDEEEDHVVSSDAGFMTPQPKVRTKRRFDDFTTVDGHTFQRMQSSGSTGFVVFDETLKAERRDVSGPWDSFWKGTSISSVFPSPSLPAIGRMEASLSLVGVESERATRPSTLARRRLKSARLAMSDDHLMDLALRKFREIILYCPEDSGAGRTMLDAAGRLVPRDEILQTLRDCLGRKAVSTCAKHAATYHKFSRWIIAKGVGRPMAPKEADIYGYVKHLQDIGSGPTAGTAFVKAVGFFEGCFRYQSTSASVFLSTRSLGAARMMSSSKRSLKHAIPFSTDHVYMLERGVADGELNPLQVAFGGFVLFCLFASGRFTDAARVKKVELEQFEDVLLIKSLAYEYKGSTISERRNKALPHQALALGLHNRSWGVRWLETRKWLELDRFKFLMPAISHRTGEFIDRRMTSSEGVDHLQELLVCCGLDEDSARSYTTHSLKRTMLHWAACSKMFTYEERQCLGHHIGNKKSMLAYSVEEMTRLQGKNFSYAVLHT